MSGLSGSVGHDGSSGRVSRRQTTRFTGSRHGLVVDAAELLGAELSRSRHRGRYRGREARGEREAERSR